MLEDTSAARKFIKTGKNHEFLATAENAFLKLLKTNATVQVEDGLIMDIYETSDTSVDNPYPVIVLVNGAGGNGKDTFVDNVGKYCSALNLSSITEIKEIANILVSISDKYDDLSAVCAGKHKEEKTDRYRQFLHSMKMAWSNFCDGPNVQLLGQLRDVCTDQINGKEKYDIVFMHVREKDEISALKTFIEDNFGLITLTVLVDGLIDSEEYTNDCDHNVNEYNHDLIIHNQYGKLDIFELQARLFASRIISGNRMFGINALQYHTIDDRSVTGMTEEDVEKVERETTNGTYVLSVENGIDPRVREDNTSIDIPSSFHTNNNALG